MSETALDRLRLLVIAALIIGSASGCATIVSDRQYAVTVDNPPAPTCFAVYDRKNQVIEQGVTPQQVNLDAKAFPFWPAKYTVVMAGNDSTSQRQEVKAGFDPWIAGNLLIGGGLGAIVDGATGAMFKLPKRITGNVAPQYAVTDTQVGHQIASSVMQRTSVPANPGDQSNPSNDTSTQVMAASHANNEPDDISSGIRR